MGNSRSTSWVKILRRPRHIGTRRKHDQDLSSSLTTLDVDAKNDGSSFCRRGASRLVNCLTPIGSIDRLRDHCQPEMMAINCIPDAASFQKLLHFKPRWVISYVRLSWYPGDPGVALQLAFNIETGIQNWNCIFACSMAGNETVSDCIVPP